MFSYCLEETASPIKMVPSLCGLPHLMTSKTNPKSYKYDNYCYCQIHLLLGLSDKRDHQAIHCPTANFGPLSKGGITNLILITVFDPNVTGNLGLSQDPSDSESSDLTHFSMSLVYKYKYLKEPYNQDIKEQVTTKNFLRRKTGFT